MSTVLISKMFSFKDRNHNFEVASRDEKHKLSLIFVKDFSLTLSYAKSFSSLDATSKL